MELAEPARGKQMTTTTRRERPVRGHAVRPGDEIRYDSKWWQVVRQVEGGTEVRWNDKGVDKVANIPDYVDGETFFAFLVRRGSHHITLTFTRTSIQRIIRGGLSVPSSI